MQHTKEELWQMQSLPLQQLKETHPAQYKYCMDKLGLREVLDYICVPYE